MNTPDSRLLWTVTVEIEMQVLAKDWQEAEEVALRHLVEIDITIGDNECISATPTLELLREWQETYPWGGDGDLTCQEYLDAQKETP